MFTSLIQKAHRSGNWVGKEYGEPTCDYHSRRPTVLVMVGEQDSMGTEYLSFCGDCVKNILKKRSLQDVRIKEGKDIEHGYCDDCGCDVVGHVDPYRDPEDHSVEDLCEKHYRMKKAATALYSLDPDDFDYRYTEPGDYQGETYAEAEARLKRSLERWTNEPLPMPYEQWVAKSEVTYSSLKERLQAKYADRLTKAV